MHGRWQVWTGARVAGLRVIDRGHHRAWRLHDPSHPISFPPVIPLSQTAAHVLFWGAAAVAIFAQTMVLRAALAGRTPAASDSTGARAREVLWIVLPAVALAFVLWFTWRALPRLGSSDLTPAAMRTAVRDHDRSAGTV